MEASLYLVGRDLTDDAIKKGKGLISTWVALREKNGGSLM